MIKLRPYQNTIKAKVYEAWAANYPNVCLVMPTGAGKTKTFCSIVIDILNSTKEPTAIMVHRKELVQQISLVLSEEGVRHSIIASRQDIKGMIAAQRRLYGKSFYDPNSTVTVISVDTLRSREENYKNWAMTVRVLIIDEAAHVTRDNKWGTARAMFVNARSLGVTATPQRLDRKGLGSHADGIFDIMVEGPTTKWLIDNGFLSKYKIAIPDSDYQKFLKKSSGDSDYSQAAMSEASRKSHIIGDVVTNYLKFAKGKQAILFGTDIQTITDMEHKFTEAGVVAKSLSSNTPDSERLEALILYQKKKIQVLLNVDLFDEGLDVPGIEVVIMARPTMSLGKFLQMVGRGLRVADGKPWMLLIDHVGNVKGGAEHGLPCTIRRWTLDRIAKRGAKLNFLRICSNFNCNAPYDRALTECPWCGEEAIKPGRDGAGGSRPSLQQVDGDLQLLDPEYVRELESRCVLENPGTIAARVNGAGFDGTRAMKAQMERLASQKQLAEAIARWAGVMKHRYGYTDRQIKKLFYLQQEQTITEALGEPRVEMDKLTEALNQGNYDYAN